MVPVFYAKRVYEYKLGATQMCAFSQVLYSNSHCKYVKSPLYWEQNFQMWKSISAFLINNQGTLAVALCPYICASEIAQKLCIIVAHSNSCMPWYPNALILQN